MLLVQYAKKKALERVELAELFRPALGALINRNVRID